MLLPRAAMRKFSEAMLNAQASNNGLGINRKQLHHRYQREINLWPISLPPPSIEAVARIKPPSSGESSLQTTPA